MSYGHPAESSGRRHGSQQGLGPRLYHPTRITGVPLVVCLTPQSHSENPSISGLSNGRISQETSGIGHGAKAAYVHGMHGGRTCENLLSRKGARTLESLRFVKATHQSPRTGNIALFMVSGPCRRRCQYIAGKPSSDDACKCRKPCRQGSPYCEEHYALCRMQSRRLNQ